MSYSAHGQIRKHKHMMCVLIVLILFVLFLIYMSWNSSAEEDDFCGCGSHEGINYANKKAKEGIKSTYSVESPALKSMFERKERLAHKHGIAEQFNVMKTASAPKTLATKTQEYTRSGRLPTAQEKFQAALRNKARSEGFSNNFTPPTVMRSVKGSTPQSPFYGQINL